MYGGTASTIRYFYTEDARKRKVGKIKRWYEGKVTKIDKGDHEYSVLFDTDKQTAVLNFSDPTEKDFIKEGHGWQKI
jgi:hypothetical protein